MRSIVCTLFEGHYHFGVAALINSLHNHGFKGDIYIGYRGALPSWAAAAEHNYLIHWKGAKTLQVITSLKLHFLPVETKSHFTNLKPDFIIQVWELHAHDAEISGIFYFDPDIVNKCNWEFYEKWITFGVALVHEIVWHDMPSSHPKRHQWASVLNELNYSITNKLSSYINAGFIGVHKRQMGFIKMWSQLIEHSVKSFKFDKTKFSQSQHGSNLFSVGDQDLLNLTAMCTDEQISEFGPEGMDFLEGGWLMSHATGSHKPWKNNYIKSWFLGTKPSRQSKEYWKNANGIINCYSPFFLKRKIFFQNVASFLSRYYSK